MFDSAYIFSQANNTQSAISQLSSTNGAAMDINNPSKRIRHREGIYIILFLFNIGYSDNAHQILHDTYSVSDFINLSNGEDAVKILGTVNALNFDDKSIKYLY